MASTREYGGEGEPVAEQSLGELVATATRDLSMLVHHEIELAKAELTEQAKRAGVGAGLFAGAAALALLSLFVLCFAAGFGIAAGASIPVWGGFLCVFGLFVIVAGGLAGMGLVSFRKVGGPELTKTTMRSTVASLRHPRRSVAANSESPNGVPVDQ